MSTPDISNLPECMDDAKEACLDEDPGPPDPTNYRQLLGRLEAVRQTLPPLYRDTVYAPYLKSLRALGSSGFSNILLRDPERNREAGLMLDIAHAILQNGERYSQTATDGFQEVISDLYDGFLSAEDRHGVRPPDQEVIPPLVKWGNPSSGPYTWPVDATKAFGLQVSVVNLPPANTRGGLFAWSALGHETGGHDIIHADNGLMQEMADVVRTALAKDNFHRSLPDYWANRIDETASDVMGILNMGPAAGIGLIGYFRGINAAISGSAKLRNNGPANDPHPADIVRGYLAAAVVRLLAFDDAKAWADLITKETDKDAGKIRLGGVPLTKEKARKSADIVAETLVRSKLTCLERHALIEIQDWTNDDERIVARLRRVLAQSVALPKSYARGMYAAHVVAAAVTAGLARNAILGTNFNRMMTILKTMHDTNTAWGPLYVRHPGDLIAHRAYWRHDDTDL